MSMRATTFVLVAVVVFVPLDAAPKEPKDLVPDDYLEQFGYLNEKVDGKQHDETSRSNAIREFQELWSLQVTGSLNDETIQKMLAPRCGLPDVIRPKDRAPKRNGRKNLPLEYNTAGQKWDHNRVTYKFVGYTRQLSQSSQRRAIRNAFDKWSAVIPLTFVETRADNADILLNFVYGNHGDGSSFDGRGGTLAHAFFPGTQSIAGDTHFDDQEQWTERTKDGTNLEIVAAHELGHALGLGHSNIEGALMQPFYSGYDPNYKLHNDDIRGVQSLYGARRAEPRPQPPVTPRPQTPRPQPRPRPPQPKPNNPDEDICDLKFDDIANGPDGRLYAFRQRKIYKFKSNGVGIERGFPRNIRKVFPKAPNGIGAAVYDRWERKFYIFKGSRIWRYSGFTLDPDFPRKIKKGWYRGVDAAMQENNGEIRLLKGSQMSVWRRDFETPPRGYPVPISTRWPGLRDNLEAAVKYQGYSFFFKGGNYFKYDDRYRRVLYRKAKAGPWLGCGRPEPK